MAIKNMLVHLDNSGTCAQRVEAAVDLARRYGARLSGLFVVPDYFIPSYVEAQISADIIAEINEQAIERAKLTLEEISSQVEKTGYGIDMQIEEGNMIGILGEYARYTDLLVLGQSQPQDPDNVSAELADHVVIEGGAPCLVIPYIGVQPTLGKRVLVAWNESREAARALRDALPLLVEADQVTVLLVKHHSHNEDHTAMQEKTMLAYLADHGIVAETSLCVDDHGDPGNAILARASDGDIDLIVMGAYGHSRLRELVLGGATRHLLKEMTVPVFISH